MIKRTVLALLTGVFLSPALSAQGTYISAGERYRDSLRESISRQGAVKIDCNLAYRLGSSVVDEAFGNNVAQLRSLQEFLQVALYDTLVVVSHVSLDGYCSPEGTAKGNDQLAYNRAHGLAKYLRNQYALINRYPLRINSHGADWKGLRTLIDQSPYTWREQALRIIDGKLSAERKKMQLGALADGEALSALYGLYPLLRRVEVKVTYDVRRTREKIKNHVRPVRAPFLPGEKVRPVPPPPFVVAAPTLTQLPYRVQQQSNKTPQNNPAEPQEPAKPLLAAKTNLLFDLLLAPNVELEIPIGKRWSVMGEYTFPWWLKRDDSRCFEMLQFGAEGRYWLGNREMLRSGKKRNLLTGYFVGAYAAGGYYDFQFQRQSGYQGEFYIAAGVSAGYARRLTRRLNMEFAIGVGVLTTKYRAYKVRREEGEEAVLVRQNYGQFLWVGPTKAKISLVWLIGKKKGGTR